MAAWRVERTAPRWASPGVIRHARPATDTAQVPYRRRSGGLWRWNEVDYSEVARVAAGKMRVRACSRLTCKRTKWCRAGIRSIAFAMLAGHSDMLFPRESMSHLAKRGSYARRTKKQAKVPEEFRWYVTNSGGYGKPVPTNTANVVGPAVKSKLEDDDLRLSFVPAQTKRSLDSAGQKGHGLLTKCVARRR